MPQENNERRGVLFKNHAKTQEQDPERREKLPDYKGEAQVRNEEFWLSAWISKSQKGETYMRLSLQPKQQSYQSAGSGAPVTDTAPMSQPTPDEEIPF
jgi:alkylated DNA repair dioxygenase AlkB